MPTEVYYEDATMTLHMAVETAARLGTEGKKFAEVTDFIFNLMMARKTKLAGEFDRAPRGGGYGGGGGGGGFTKKYEDTNIPCGVCADGHMTQNTQYIPEDPATGKSNPKGPWQKCSNQKWNKQTNSYEGCTHVEWDREMVTDVPVTGQPAPAAVPREEYGPSDAPF